MAFANVRQGIQMLATQLQQIIDALKGTPGRGQRISLTNLASATDYSLTIQNTGTGGKALLVRDSSGNTLMDVTNSGVSLGSPSFTTAIYVPTDASSGNLDPEYSFTGDTNTGIYSSAADTLHIVTGGANRITVDSSGNVGIGSAPGAYALDVTGQMRSSTGLVVTAGGATVTAGGVTVSAGDVQATTGTFLAPVDGSSGNLDPEYTFIGDTNTGLYSSAADTLHLVTGGSNRLTIDALGNVGIAGAPGAYALDVTGQIRTSTGLLVTAGGATVTAGGLTITAGGATITADGLTVNGGGISLGASGGGITFHASNSSALTMGTGQIIARNDAGTASLPAYTFSGDTDTGMYHGSVNELRFATAGTRAIEINSSQQVGIGKTPTVALDVSGAVTATGAVTGGSFVTAGNLTVDTSVMFVDATNDRVSIQTTTFDATDTTYTTKLKVAGAIRSTSGGIIFPDNSVQTSAAVTSSSVTSASDVTLGSDTDSSGAGDILFQTKGSTKLSIPTLATTGGVIEFVNAATPAATASASNFRFYVKSDGRVYVRGNTLSEAEPDAIGAAQYYVKVGTGLNAATWAQLLRVSDGSATTPVYSFGADSGTGIYRSGTGEVAIAGAAAQTHVFASTFHRGPNGAQATPAFSFTGDTDTGMYWLGSNQIGFSVGNSQVAQFLNTGTAIVSRFPDGTSGEPGISFISDTNTGMYRLAADSVGIVTGSTLAGQFTNTGTAIVARFGAGTTGEPSIGFISDTNTGIYNYAADNIGFTTGGTTQMVLDSTGGLIMKSSSGITPTANAAYHQSLAKGWCYWDTTGAVYGHHNVSSVTDNGTGDWTINWDRDFSSTAYCAISDCRVDGDYGTRVANSTTDAGVTRIYCHSNTSGTKVDPNNMYAVAFGTQ